MDNTTFIIIAAVLLLTIAILSVVLWKTTESSMRERRKLAETSMREQTKLAETSMREQVKMAETSMREQAKILETSMRERAKAEQTAMRERVKVFEVSMRYKEAELRLQADSLVVSQINPTTITKALLAFVRSAPDDMGENVPAPLEAWEQERKPVKRPSEKALAVWRLRDLLGINDQTELAQKMTELGTPMSQPSVSRYLTAVENYLAAGNILSPMPQLDKKATACDPGIIDMGARQDGRTPRQRPQRDPDSEDE